MSNKGCPIKKVLKYTNCFFCSGTGRTPESVLAELITDNIETPVLFGSATINDSDVLLWLKNGVVPAEYVRTIERICEYTVMRYELRPDIYPKDEYQAVEKIQQLRSVLSVWNKGAEKIVE